MYCIVTIALAADLHVGPAQPYASVGDAFDAASSGDRILVEPGTYSEPAFELDEEQVLTIEGTGPGVVIQSSATYRAFMMGEDAELTLVDLELDAMDLVGTISAPDGGSITLQGVTFRNARAPGGAFRAGSIYADQVTVFIENSVFDGAAAPGLDAGHLVAIDADVTIVGSTFRQGSAANGGAIYAEDSTLYVEGTVFEDNVAEADGGAIWAGEAWWGGGWGVGVGSDVHIVDSVFRNGQADDGAGVFAREADLQIERTVFEGNLADDDGASVWSDGGSVDISDSAFLGEIAIDDGVVACRNMGSCDVTGSLFDGTSAVEGAILYADDVWGVELYGVTGCRLLASDSLIEVRDSDVDIQGTAIASFGGSEAGLRFDLLSDATLTNNTLVLGDSADGVVVADGSLGFVNNLVAYNTTTSGAAVVASGPFTGGHNAYFDNAGGDVDPSTFGTDLVGIDPDLVGALGTSCATELLRPNPTSPLVDAGDPSILDTDGSRSDIGAFGGQQANEGIDDLEGVDDDGDGYAGSEDCDDSDPLVNPDAVELPCNGVDEDCDPTTLDDGDADGDGVGICDGDCDDSSASVVPGGKEVPCNGIDDDCDAVTPDGEDRDGDGYAACADDCDDSDALVNPGVVEVECNGVDDDCDPATDDGYDGDGDGVPACLDCDDEDPTASEMVTAYADVDQDGYGVGNPVAFCGQPPSTALVDGDCDSQDPTIYPGAEEVPDDGIDQDCDGSDLTDLDGDGVSLADGDCADDDPSRYPGAEDVPDDGIDQDCTGFDVSLTVGGAAGWQCGCSSSSPAGGGLAGLLGLLAVARRRR